MTEIADSAVAEKPGGLGIKTKLLLAFAGVAGLTLFGSTVALVSYGHVNDAFDKVARDGLPAITSSLELAREAAEVAALAPVLLGAEDRAALDAARASVVDKTWGMASTLRKIKRNSVGSATANKLADALKALEDSMGRLGSEIDERLAATISREHAMAAAVSAHQRLAQKIVPVVDQARGDLGGRRALLDLSELRAEANLLVGLLSEASLVPRTELLAPLGDRFSASAAKALGTLARVEEAGELRTQLDALLAIGRGPENVFELRRQELVGAAEAVQALQATRAAAAALTGEVSLLVGDARAASGKAIDASDGTVDAARTLLVAIALLSIVLAAAAWLYVGHSVVTRLKRLNGAMLALANGDLAVQIPHKGRDELSAMAKAVEVFKQHAVTSRELEAEKRKAQEQREARHRSVETQIRRFDSKVGALLEALDGASRQMTAVADTMAGTAEEASHQAAAVAAASGDASENVRSVAAAAEEISVNVGEITQQITKSSHIAGRAVVEAERTDRTVRGLADAASKIGEVVQLIQAIAGQTNLLALNATIEAARAGEAGRGFAVVAAEVKALANQTGKATDEIGGQVAAIQAATREAVQAIQGIGETIGDIDRISTSIAAAMNQQGATTAEIARATHHAARGTQQVSQSIAVVSEATSHTGVAAEKVLNAATDLSAKADELRSEVDAFLQHIRAA